MATATTTSGGAGENLDLSDHRCLEVEGRFVSGLVLESGATHVAIGERFTRFSDLADPDRFPEPHD